MIRPRCSAQPLAVTEEDGREQPAFGRPRELRIGVEVVVDVVARGLGPHVVGAEREERRQMELWGSVGAHDAFLSYRPIGRGRARRSRNVVDGRVASSTPAVRSAGITARAIVGTSTSRTAGSSRTRRREPARRLHERHELIGAADQSQALAGLPRRGAIQPVDALARRALGGVERDLDVGEHASRGRRPHGASGVQQLRLGRARHDEDVGQAVAHGARRGEDHDLALWRARQQCWALDREVLAGEVDVVHLGVVEEAPR